MFLVQCGANRDFLADEPGSAKSSFGSCIRCIFREEHQEKMYRPASLVTADRAALVAVSVRVTVAPTTAALDGLVQSTWTEPVEEPAPTLRVLLGDTP